MSLLADADRHGSDDSDFRFWRILLQMSFCATDRNFSGHRRGDRMIMWGTISTGDELTGNFSTALVDTLTGDSRLFCLLAEN